MPGTSIRASASSVTTARLQGRRRVDRQQGQGHRRADPVGADEGLEAGPLVPAREAVEDDGVLPDMGVHVDEGGLPGSADLAEGARRHQHPVADPADLEQDLGGLTASAPTGRGRRPAGTRSWRRPSRWRRRPPATRPRTDGRWPGPGRRPGPAAGAARPGRAGPDHALHLLLGGRAVAGDRQLDLVRAVLRRPGSRPGGRGQGQAAGLADRHGGAGIDLEQHPLDHHHVRAQLGQQTGAGPPTGRPAVRSAGRRAEVVRWPKAATARRPRVARATAPYPQRDRPGSTPRANTRSKLARPSGPVVDRGALELSVAPDGFDQLVGRAGR